MKTVAHVLLLAGAGVVMCAPNAPSNVLAAKNHPLVYRQAHRVASSPPPPSQSPPPSTLTPQSYASWMDYLGRAFTGYNTLYSPMKPYKTIQLQPKLRKEAIRERQIWGPYTFLPSDNATSNMNTASGPPVKGMDPEGQTIWNTFTGFCSDCTVLHGSTYLSNVDGRQLESKDGAYLHHSLIIPYSRLELPYWSCAEDGQPPRKPVTATSFFLAGGVDAQEHFFTSEDGKYNSGYYLPKDSKYSVQAEAINFKSTPQSWYIAAEIEYLPGKPKGLEVVTLSGISVSTCESFTPSGSVYKPPKGVKKFNFTSPRFILDRDLALTRAIGHIHEGGVSNTLLLNGKAICNAEAVYGGSKVTYNREDGEKWEAISHMTPCVETIQMKKGDVLTMMTYYDTERHPIRQAHTHAHGGDEEEAMGMFSLFLAEKNSQRWD